MEHQIASGIAMGAIYVCLALAVVMIYQSTGHINFAQGEMAMFSTFVAWLCLGAGVPYWGAAIIAMTFGFVGGFLIERVIMRPLTGAPDLAIIAIFVALFVGINSLAGWIFTHEVQSFPSPFPERAPFGITVLSGHEFGVICVVLVVTTALFSFLRFARLGLAMRAAAASPVNARLSGIPVSFMLSLGWGLSALIGAIAGIMVAPAIFLEPGMMGGILIYAFAAALLGGIDNPWGAVAGGIIIGVLENLAGAYLVGTGLKLSVALVAIVAVLLIRPSGLFGRKLVERV